MHVIATSYDCDRIDSMRRRLHARGINTHVTDELTGSTPLGDELPPMRLQIAEQDLPRLHRMLASDAELRALIMPERPSCPRCGSGNLRHAMDPASNIVGLIFSFLPRPRDGSRLHCRECGHQWDLAPSPADAKWQVDPDRGHENHWRRSRHTK